jgi:hypothetical protein
MLKYILPLLILLTACGTSEEPKQEQTEREKPKVVVSFKNEAEMDRYAAGIDSIVAKSGLVASSLYYSKDAAGESIQVDGHMNDDNEIMKIEEIFNDGEGKNNGRRFYYLNGGKPFITRELYDEVNGDRVQFVDRVSYYDAKGKVIKTKERRGDYEELVEQMTYKPVPLAGITMDRAMRAINQQGEFETTFQGFVDSDMFTYLSVGENKPDGFRSALRLDYKDELILMLRSNQEGYLGEKIRVNYEKRVEDNGFSFQVYAGGKFAD